MSSKAGSHPHTLRDLYTAELRDLLSLEAAADVITAMVQVSRAAALREVLEKAAGQARHHAHLLESLVSGPHDAETPETAQGAIGLLEMGRRLVRGREASAVLDAALVICVQKMAHYKMAAYGSVRSFAGILGDVGTHARLQECLNEEADIDRRLTQLAEDSLNVLALGKPPAGAKASGEAD